MERFWVGGTNLYISESLESVKSSDLCSAKETDGLVFVSGDEDISGKRVAAAFTAIGHGELEKAPGMESKLAALHGF